MALSPISDKNGIISRKALRSLLHLGTSHLSFFISIVVLFFAALEAAKELGVSLPELPQIPVGPASRWIIIVLGSLVALFTLSLRFPRIISVLLTLAVAPPDVPGDLPRLFRGPVPYNSEDQSVFHGRRADIDQCWERIVSKRLFVLDGESGCGKSSLLNAALVPKARSHFRVVECRIANDPYGKLFAAVRQEPYNPHHSLPRSALNDETQARNLQISRSFHSVGTAPFIIFIDQFEELFVTVPKSVQIEFLRTLKSLIEMEDLRLVVALRSDFLDLLVKAFVEVDPQGKTLDLGNYHTLRSFQPAQAQGVLENIFAPVVRGNALLIQRVDNFNRALTKDLLRPPIDKRVSRADRPSILPVELQTVCMVLEKMGADHFSESDFRRLGGKLGLYRRFIEDAKEYVWRKTGITGEKSLIVLRKLISPSMTKWSRTPESIARETKLSARYIKAVLDAFAEKYLVRLLVENGSGPSYELMHEHLVQILADAPDPILQRLRDAEEQLRFFAERENSRVFYRANSRTSWAVRKTRDLLSQPLSFFDALRLRKFASDSASRWIVRRSLRSFIIRILFVSIPILIFTITWSAWIRTDAYQIRRILSEAPIQQVDPPVAGQNLPRFGQKFSSSLIDWASALVIANRPAAAIDVVSRIQDPQARLEASVALSEDLLASGKETEASRLLDEATAASPEIVDHAKRAESLVRLSNMLRKFGRGADADRALDAAQAACQKTEPSSFEFVEVADALFSAGRSELANQIVNEALISDSVTDTSTLAGSGFGETHLARLVGVLLKLGRSDDAKVLLAKANAKFSRFKSNPEFQRDESTYPTDFVALANLMMKVGMKSDAHSLLVTALQKINKRPRDIDNRTILDIGRGFVELDDIDMCLKAAKLIDFEYPVGLGHVIRVLTEKGNFDAAFAAARLAKGEEDHEQAVEDIAEAMVLHNRIESAMAIVNSVDNQTHRSQLAIAVAKALIKSGRTNDADEILRQEVPVALAIQNDISRANRLIVLAKLFEDVGQNQQSSSLLDRAVEAAGSHSNNLTDDEESIRSSAYSDLPRSVTKPRSTVSASRALPPGMITDRFYYLIESLVGAGRATEVLPIIRASRNNDFKASSFIVAAKSFKESNQFAAAKSTLNEALLCAYQIREPKEKGLNLLEIAEEQIELRDTSGIGETLRAALIESNKARDYTDRYLAIASIAKGLIQIGLFDDAVAALESIKENDQRYYSLNHLLRELELVPNIENKSTALSKLREVVVNINNDAHRSELTAEVAQQLAHQHRFREARLMVSDCSSNDRLMVYATILSEYSRSTGAASYALVDSAGENR